MPAIGVVDDRSTQRRQLVRGIDTSDVLPEGWRSLGINPLNTITEYPNWINENDVAALVLDERLQEQQADVEVHVNYDGHDVVDYLRKTIPDFPIFIVTAAPNDPGLGERFAAVEDIINREDFVRKSKKLVPRIIRSGQRFFESNEDKLARLETLSVLVAKGEAGNEEIKELNALRAQFQLPYEDQLQSPEGWIADFDENIQKLQELESRISKYVVDKGLEHDS